MINIKLKIVTLILSTFILMGCYTERKASDYGFYSATVSYLNADISNIDFNNLNRNPYNDLVYKSILVKFTIFQVYPKDVDLFKLKNLDANTLNNLCLASIFVEEYEPMNNEIADAYESIRKDLIKSRDIYLDELNNKRILKKNDDCKDMIEKKQGI